MLEALDIENKSANGVVERYIYNLFIERQDTVASIIAAVDAADPATFQVSELLTLFVKEAGIRRSIDKAYEIVTYALFEAVVRGLGRCYSKRAATKRRSVTGV